MVNSMNITPAQGRFVERGAYQRTDRRIAPDTTTYPSVNVDISELARRKASVMFAQNNAGNVEELRLQEFIGKELLESIPEEALREAWLEYVSSLPEEARRFISRTNFFLFAPDLGLGSGAFTTENVPMAKLGYQLMDSLDLSQSDTLNFISLGNKYAELRQSLTDTNPKLNTVKGRRKIAGFNAFSGET